jgi:hypothetical protein
VSLRGQLEFYQVQNARLQKELTQVSADKAQQRAEYLQALTIFVRAKGAGPSHAPDCDDGGAAADAKALLWPLQFDHSLRSLAIALNASARGESQSGARARGESQSGDSARGDGALLTWVRPESLAKLREATANLARLERDQQTCASRRADALLEAVLSSVNLPGSIHDPPAVIAGIEALATAMGMGFPNGRQWRQVVRLATLRGYAWGVCFPAFELQLEEKGTFLENLESLTLGPTQLETCPSKDDARQLFFRALAQPHPAGQAPRQDGWVRRFSNECLVSTEYLRELPFACLEGWPQWPTELLQLDSRVVVPQILNKLLEQAGCAHSALAAAITTGLDMNGDEAGDFFGTTIEDYLRKQQEGMVAREHALLSYGSNAVVSRRGRAAVKRYVYCHMPDGSSISLAATCRKYGQAGFVKPRKERGREKPVYSSAGCTLPEANSQFFTHSSPAEQGSWIQDLALTLRLSPTCPWLKKAASNACRPSPRS